MRGAPLASVWYEPPAEADEAASQLVVVGHLYARRTPRAKWELAQVVTARGADAFALSTSQASSYVSLRQRFFDPGARPPGERCVSWFLDLKKAGGRLLF